MAEEIKRQKLKEEALTTLFLTLDELEDVQKKVGSVMLDLLDAGETRQSLQELSGLSGKEVNNLLDLANSKPAEKQDEKTQSN